MTKRIKTEQLTIDAFAPFGDVLDTSLKEPIMINQGMCERFHDLASLSFEGDRAKAGISIFSAVPRKLPYSLEMVERHPLGSQAFIPMTENPFLVIVAPDEAGTPGTPRAFLTKPGQGVNYLKNTWHGVLTPLYDPGLFAVVDRIGENRNLEEYWFDAPFTIEEH